MILSSILLTLLWSTLGVAQAPYTLADLSVLAEEGSHEEFFTHALDVRPSERQGDWKSMVTKMGESLTKSMLKKSEIKDTDFERVEDLYAWPVLKADDVFRLRRQEIGLRYLKKCLHSPSPCWPKLKAFWERDRKDPDTAYKLSEMTATLKDSPLSSWGFLEVALKSPLSEFYCKKAFVMDTLWAKIEIDYIKLGPEGDLMKKIDHTIHPDCMPSLIHEARQRLYHPPKTFDREVAFQILDSQSKATEEIKDFFYTVYLLDNPSQGELFNYSWNRVRELGKKVGRREAVLKTMKGLDPLPDAILSSLDQTKKRVILTHFKTYFPEYLDFYTDQCVEFYGGKGSFPKGNPTIHCQEFMKSELAPKILDQFKLKRFQDVVNI